MNKSRLNPEMVEFYRGIPGDNGRPLLNEVVEIFQVDLPELLQKIETCRQAGDHTGLKAAAHQIKGSAGNFGAMHLVQLARALEESAEKAESVPRERVEALEKEAGLLSEELRGCL